MHEELAISGSDKRGTMLHRVRSMGNGALFGLSILLGVLILLGAGAYNRFSGPARVDAKHLAANIWVTEQIKLESIPRLSRDYVRVIDMRPDGEAVDQPSSDAVGRAVRARHVDFSYIPVPHGDIPDSAIQELTRQLSSTNGPVLLYCRSGRRAARTWSLVEASRSGGLAAADIEAAVKASGQSVYDLAAEIDKRVANRASSKSSKI